MDIVSASVAVAINTGSHFLHLGITPVCETLTSFTLTWGTLHAAFPPQRGRDPLFSLEFICFIRSPVEDRRKKKYYTFKYVFQTTSRLGTYTSQYRFVLITSTRCLKLSVVTWTYKYKPIVYQMADVDVNSLTRYFESCLTPSTPSVRNCCCSKGSAPYWSNPPSLIFDIRALWRSVLSARAPEWQKLKMVG